MNYWEQALVVIQFWYLIAGKMMVWQMVVFLGT